MDEVSSGVTRRSLFNVSFLEADQSDGSSHGEESKTDEETSCNDRVVKTCGNGRHIGVDQIVGPVSYTHLDVYKRQRYGYS